MRSELVVAPGGIGYPFWQTGAGRPLVLLHGFTGSHETWLPLVTRFAETRLVATLDLPGHGRSQLPSSQTWSFASVVDDLAWLIAALPGGAADLLGYSMGGRIALALAATHPDRVRNLVLESASPGIADDQERDMRVRADAHLADRLQESGIEAFVADWEQLPMWQSQAKLSEHDRERQRRIRLSHTPDGLAANLRATGAGAQPSYWAQLSSLQMPALLIAGGLDRKFTHIANAMNAAIPNSWLEIVPNAGHAVHLEQPAVYVQLVSQFLNRTVAKAS
ncbi:MAG: 2-succinyl-6-hydroxy-2,4-cyclohexadiene-1-carboxylate synthase [Thermomicrobiales bacterium]|nr:2-succinyl-6-hydroxy-2,4-cyclohexadiene-1-carboxylate synthase [Thermomicrobiales bacterium]